MLKKNKNKKVIIADNTLYSRNLIKKILVKENYVIVGEVLNGYDAIDAYRRLKPDIIIIDMDLPLLNGIETTEAIIKQYGQAKILIVAGDYELKNEAINAGAINFIRKPINDKSLIQGLEESTNQPALIKDSEQKGTNSKDNENDVNEHLINSEIKVSNLEIKDNVEDGCVGDENEIKKENSIPSIPTRKKSYELIENEENKQYHDSTRIPTISTRKHELTKNEIKIENEECSIRATVPVPYSLRNKDQVNKLTNDDSYVDDSSFVALSNEHEKNGIPKIPKRSLRESNSNDQKIVNTIDSKLNVEENAEVDKNNIISVIETTNEQDLAKERAELIAKIKAEEEAKIRAEILEKEKAKAEAEAKIRAEKDALREQELAKEKAELIAKIKAEEEAKIRAEILEKEKAKAEAEAKIKAEKDALREQELAKEKAELIAKIKSEEEAKIRAEILEKEKAKAETEDKNKIFKEVDNDDGFLDIEFELETVSDDSEIKYPYENNLQSSKKEIVEEQNNDFEDIEFEIG